MIRRNTLTCLSAIFLAWTSTTVMAGAAEITDASVARDESDPQARIVTWTVAPAGTPVTVAVSTDPLADPKSAQVIGRDLPLSEFRYDADLQDGRVYFTLTPKGGAPVKTALRVLPLEGGRNFRDLGGYEAGDDKTVKWGQAFRSGVMHRLTKDDYAYLSSLGIAVICDFRSREERADEPTNWLAGEIDYVVWDYSTEEDGSGFEEVLSNPDATPEDVTQLMISLYHEIAYQHADRYKVMFDRLAKGEIPLAFNCSAGKDRAGTAAALLLTALGVPRETVVADYALSEQVVDYAAEFAAPPKDGAGEDGEGEDSPYAYLSALPPELIAPLLRSDPRYIEAALDTLTENHGSVLAFIQDELEVTDEELAAIRSALLE